MRTKRMEWVDLLPDLWDLGNGLMWRYLVEWIKARRAVPVEAVPPTPTTVFKAAGLQDTAAIVVTRVRGRVFPPLPARLEDAATPPEAWAFMDAFCYRNMGKCAVRTPGRWMRV